MDTNLGELPARQHLPVTAAAPHPAAGALDPVAPGAPVLDVVIPVYNEEGDLERCVRRLHAHLSGTFPYPFRITVADNASTDLTPAVAKALAAELPEVESFRLEQKGRGRALRTVWTASKAPVLAYMDGDLSTDLNALLPLVAPLILPIPRAKPARLVACTGAPQPSVPLCSTLSPVNSSTVSRISTCSGWLGSR